jgi:hypothetical protein
MKSFFKIALLAMTISMTQQACYNTHTISGTPGTEVNVEIGYNDFYDALNPYGRWMDYSTYGRVWICNEAGFSPYSTRGHWAYTDFGWTWVSYYDWGWAPFHYGRWIFDGAYGWLWIPGYEWAPAWVSWRSGGGYYGWAPLGPGFNISINESFGAIPAEHWCFLPNRYMGQTNINNYYINRTNNTTIINNTTVINNTYNYHKATYLSGPRRDEVERNSGHSIETQRFNDVKNPRQSNAYGNNAINVYRPTVNKDRDRNQGQNFPNKRDNSVQGNNNTNPQQQNPNYNPRKEKVKTKDKNYPGGQTNTPNPNNNQDPNRVKRVEKNNNPGNGGNEGNNNPQRKYRRRDNPGRNSNDNGNGNNGNNSGGGKGKRKDKSD